MIDATQTCVGNLTPDEVQGQICAQSEHLG